MNPSVELVAAVYELRLKLEKEKNLEVVMSAFFELCRTRDVAGLGVPRRHPKLDTALGVVLRRLVPEHEGPVTSTSICCPSLRLYHGLIATPRGLGTFFFFEGLDRGMCAVAGAGDSVYYARFGLEPRASCARISLEN